MALLGCGRYLEPAISSCDPPCGRVGEWLKPADCKSAAPCGLRRFESSPVHHLNRIAREVLKRERSVLFFVTVPRREIRWGKTLGVIVSPPCMRQIDLAWVAQLVERVLGKDEVTGSIPVPGSRGRLILAGRAGVTQR